MPLLTISDFLNLKKAHQRILGLDVGTKTVGIAVSDPTGLVASPLKLLKRSHLTADVTALINLYRDYDASCFVVGLPLNMKGTEGPQAILVRTFVEFLLKTEDVPVFLWDERLSTVAVTRTLSDTPLSKKRQAKVVDKLAAAYILQGSLYLT
jgi:putative holliday junction resolvase